MIRRTWLACVLATLALVGATPSAQEQPIETQLERIGLKADVVSTFFDAMRKAFGTNNHQAVCAMVAYPLRQPSGMVADAAACDARFDEIFPVTVRRAVGKQLFNELFIDSSKGILVGLGELWFTGKCRDAACREGDFRITEVNGSADAALKPPKGKMLLACRVGGQSLRVTADGNGSAGFRLWRGASTAETPVVDVARPAPVPGVAPGCESRAWIFTDKADEYTVFELQCAQLHEMPAMGTVGEVTLRRGGAEVTRGWCFE